MPRDSPLRGNRRSLNRGNDSESDNHLRGTAAIIGRVRILLGSLIAALALAGAVYLHSGVRVGSHWRVSDRANDGSVLVASSAVLPGDACNPHSPWKDPYGPACKAVHYRKAWQNPLAIFLAVAGVGAGIGIVVHR